MFYNKARIFFVLQNKLYNAAWFSDLRTDVRKLNPLTPILHMCGNHRQ